MCQYMWLSWFKHLATNLTCGLVLISFNVGARLLLDAAGGLIFPSDNPLTSTHWFLYSLNHLIFFKSTGTLSNFSTSKSSPFVFEIFKPVGMLTNLLISSLSILIFKAIKSLSAAKLDILVPEASFNSF